MAEDISPISVASKRLRERKDNVVEQLEIVEKYVSDLDTLKNCINEDFIEKCSKIDDQVTSMKKILDEKKIRVIGELEIEKDEGVNSITSSINLAKLAMTTAKQVITNADDLEREQDQDIFFGAYSSVNNSLEERFVDLLLLMDRCKSQTRPSKSREINFSEFLEEVTLLRCHDKDTSDIAENPTIASSPSLSYGTNEIEIASTESELFDSSQMLELDTSFDIADSHDNLTGLGEVTVGDSVSGDLCKLKHLELHPGMSLQVCVTEVTNPQKFVVQPLDTDLICMMQEIGDHYCNEEYVAVDYHPQVGEFCVAQFLEDECWYRARLIDIKDVDSLIQVKVSYVDYGNQEIIPFSRIQPIDERFCRLPCQAINCSLNVYPFQQQSCLAHPHNGVWSDTISAWLSSLLLGKSIEVSISDCLQPNQVLLEAFLPNQDLKDSVFTNFYDNDTLSQDVLSLSLFMSAVGFSCSNGDARKLLEDHSCSRESLALAACVKEDYDGLSSGSFGVSNIRISSLPPLVLKLNSSLEFTCLVSHITEDLLIYIHPVQADLACVINYINDTLHDHYSAEENRIRLTSNELKCGSICVIYSIEFQQWCRGSIVSIRSDITSEEKVRCLIFFIDYGGSELVDISDIFCLINSLSGYPAQAVCCNLDVKCAGSSRRIMSNPDIKCDVENVPISNKIEKFLLQCVNFLQHITDDRQLVGVLKGEVRDDSDDYLLLTIKIDHMLLMDLYDTNGEYDKHINERLMDYFCHTQGDMNNELLHWNPMEEDFLSKRNIYKFSDEDVGLALDGYKTTSSICRFFSTTKGCQEGENCRFLHLHKEVLNRQVEDAVIESDNHLSLPRRNDWIIVIVTSVVSAVRFYVQLPLGCKSPLSADRSCDELELDFISLKENMTSYYNQQVFCERNVILPHTGEIIAALYLEDSNWYRARIVDSKDDTLTVFYVDYGNMGTVADINVRSLKPEFLVVPFQAVECHLANVQVSPSYFTKQDISRKLFTTYIQDVVLVAKVIDVETNGSLGLELYSASDHGLPGVDVIKELVENDVLICKCMTPASHDKINFLSTVIRPG